MDYRDMDTWIHFVHSLIRFVLLWLARARYHCRFTTERPSCSSLCQVPLLLGHLKRCLLNLTQNLWNF